MCRTHKVLEVKCRAAERVTRTDGKETRGFLPPLLITQEEMDKGLAIMAQVMK
mgnify:CR=1 FL=1